MFRRKTIIVLVITLMVTVMVTAFSILYISQILRLRIANANETATSLTHQLAYAASNAVPGLQQHIHRYEQRGRRAPCVGGLRSDRRRPQ